MMSSIAILKEKAVARMGTKLHAAKVSGILTRIVAHELGVRGFDPAPTLAKVGLPANFLVDKDARALFTQQRAFLEAAAVQAGDPLLAFHTADRFDVRKGGLLFYVMASASSLEDGINQVVRYIPIENEAISETYSRNGEFATLSWSAVGRDEPLDRSHMEFFIAVTVRLFRYLSNVDVVPVTVHFSQPAIADIGPLKAFFRCPIEFDAPRDQLTFTAATSALPVARSDPYLNELLKSFAERLVERLESRLRSFGKLVEHEILAHLSDGVPASTELARRLGLSKRTFERRLNAEGLNLRQVTDGLRRDLAIHYLRETDRNVTEIAWMLGFSDTSSFTRFFKRAMGVPPSGFRADGFPLSREKSVPDLAI